MKRIEKTLLHNPDICPFGLAAHGEKLEQGEEKLEITKEEKYFYPSTSLPFFFENIIPSFSCKSWLKTNGAKKKTHNPITVYRNKSYK